MERPSDKEKILLSSLEVKLFIVRQRKKRPLISKKLEVACGHPVQKEESAATDVWCKLLCLESKTHHTLRPLLV